MLTFGEQIKEAKMSKGIIHQIIGPVIDIKFNEDEMPELLNAINITHEGKLIVTEVAQHIGDDVARCIALSSTDGLRRGMEAVDTGEPIKVPVGKEVLGRMFNVIGDTIDEKGGAESIYPQGGSAFRGTGYVCSDIRDRYQGHRPYSSVYQRR